MQTHTIQVFSTQEITSKDKVKRVFDFLALQENTNPLEDAIAIKRNGNWLKISTHEFRKQADLISLGLLNLGLKKGDVVGIIGENCPEWNFADLAAIQLGCVVVPLYPNASARDYEYILQHSEAKVIFVGNQIYYDKVMQVKGNLPDVLEIYTLDKVEGAKHWTDLTNKVKNQSTYILEKHRMAVEPEDLMTLMYTSGTTGTPKGVMISHDNLVFNINSLQELDLANSVIQKSPEKPRALSFLPLCHVFEKSSFYSYMAQGISMYYAESLEKIGDNLREVKPHVFTTVPRLLEKVYEKIEAKANELKGIKRSIFFWALGLAQKFKPEQALSGWYGFQMQIARKLVFSKWKEALGGNVGLVISGASALQPRLAQIFWAAGIPIMEGYGQSESTPTCSVNAFGKDQYLVGTTGRIIPNIEVKIVPEEGYRQGEGEICIKGRNVMKGYYKKPDITAETVTDGWLHTGDIGLFVDIKNNIIPLTETQSVKHQDTYFLKITDRKKEIFKTSGGKYIAPLQLETKFKESHLIEQMAVVGEYQKFPAALIVPSFDNLRVWAGEHGLAFANNSEMVKHPMVLEKFESIRNEYNQFFGQYEQIKKIALLDKEWTVESNELTPTMKTKRRVIQENYKHLIDGFYQE